MEYTLHGEGIHKRRRLGEYARNIFGEERVGGFTHREGLHTKR